MNEHKVSQLAQRLNILEQAIKNNAYNRINDKIKTDIAFLTEQ